MATRPKPPRSDDELEPWPKYRRPKRIRKGRYTKKTVMAAGRRMLKGKTQEERSSAASVLRAYRTAKMTVKERRELGRKAANAYWDSMSEAERKIEMKRRAAVRKKRRMQKKLKRIRKGV